MYDLSNLTSINFANHRAVWRRCRTDGVPTVDQSDMRGLATA